MLLEWLQATPLALQVVAWLVLPGLAATLALGLRGLAAWACAPAVTVALVATAAVLADVVGVPWTPWVVLAATGGLVGLGSLAALGLRRWTRERPVPAHGGGVAITSGLAFAVVVTGYPMARGMEMPNALAQTYDAVFHLNALRYISEHASASALTVGGMTAPGSSGTLYPAGWHALASLPVLAGADPVATTNLLSICVSAVVWPAGCALLVRCMVGHRPRVVAATAVLSGLFLAFPTTLAAFGTLWPNLLGLALVPSGLAMAVVLAGAATDAPVDRWRAGLVFMATAGATALAHPNALFSLLVLSSIAGAGGAVVVAREAESQARRFGAVLVAAALPATIWVALARLRHSGVLGSVAEFDWPARSTFAQAVGEALLLGLNERAAQWALAGLVLLGAFVAARRFRWAWLVVAYLVVVLGYAWASGTDRWPSQELTGLWYNDPQRMAAMVPLVAVPLAGVGSVCLVDALRRSVKPGRRGTAVLVVSALVGLVLSEQLYRVDRAQEVGSAYNLESRRSAVTLVDEDERAWMESLRQVLPADAVVASNPWDGSALLWALADREVLYPHLVGQWDPDRELVAHRLSEAATDPTVCSALRRLGVEWVIDSSGPRFWPWDDRQEFYEEGFTGLPAVGFRPVSAGGGMVLYRITACSG